MTQTCANVYKRTSYCARVLPWTIWRWTRKSSNGSIRCWRLGRRTGEKWRNRSVVSACVLTRRPNPANGLTKKLLKSLEITHENDPSGSTQRLRSAKWHLHTQRQWHHHRWWRTKLKWALLTSTVTDCSSALTQVNLMTDRWSRKSNRCYTDEESKRLLYASSQVSSTVCPFKRGTADPRRGE